MEKKNKFNGQTWDILDTKIRNMKIVLFGASAFAGSFFSRYSKSQSVSRVADNDSRKQGMRLCEILGDSAGASGDVIIQEPKEALTGMEPSGTIIIIASLHYDEIGEQINELGFYNCYSIPVMDAACGIDGRMDKHNPNIDGRREFALKYSTLPISTTKIVVLMGNFGGHGKYITLALLKKGVPLDLVWIVRTKRKEIPEGVRMVFESDWDSYYMEMETAAIWVFDDMLPPGLIKRKGQTYIQTKHWASITLKTFYMDDDKYRNEPRTAEKSLHDAKWMDYIFSGSEFDEESCRTGFLFQGQFVRVGSPRSDAMFDPSCRKKVIDEYGLEEGTKLALYAPTLRYIKDAALVAELRWQELDFEMLKESLTERFGGEWKILLRAHPSVAIETSRRQFPSFVLDAGFYEDGEELCSASDVMITDYSSIMFEPAFVGKPVFLYAPDRKEYINEERKLLIDYDNLPFPKALTNEELCLRILDFKGENYRSSIQRFFEAYHVKEDGKASVRAAGFIMDLLNHEK